MQLSGAYTFDAPAEKVWTAITDPKTLCACIPGCQSLDDAGDNQYQVSLNISMGPINGKYNAAIGMEDITPHLSFRLTVQANGPMGFANGYADIKLEEDGGKTQVVVDADSQVGGAVARVGQRLMGTVAKTTMDRFFNCLQGKLK